MEHAFHIYNKMASDGVAMSTDKLLRLNEQGKTIWNEAFIIKELEQ